MASGSNIQIFPFFMASPGSTNLAEMMFTAKAMDGPCRRYLSPFYGEIFLVAVALGFCTIFIFKDGNGWNEPLNSKVLWTNES